MATAYEEALSGAATPSYIDSADSLSIANRNQSFADSASDAVDSIGKFIGLSVISGANQLYNIAPSIGNALGGSYELRDTGDIVADLDRDLGKFYEEHQQGIDLVGFLASSLVPGAAGIKVLNAGQRGLQAAISAGKYGPKMGRAMGLLVPSSKKALPRAIEQVHRSNAVPGLLNREGLRAIAFGGKVPGTDRVVSGTLQNMLEGFAAEIAIAGTMFESPILDDMDMGDLVANVALGVGLSGLVGGAISATKVNSALKQAADTEAKLSRPWTEIREVAKASPIDEKTVSDLEQFAYMPSVYRTADMTEDLYNSLINKFDAKQATLNNRFRKNLSELTGANVKGKRVKDADEKLADVMYAYMKPGKDGARYVDQQAFFTGLRETTRLADSGPIYKKLESTYKKAGKQDLKAMNDLLDGEYKDMAVGYVRFTGDRMGEIIEEAPTPIFISDMLTKKSPNIRISGGKVHAGSYTSPKFSLSLNRVSKKKTKVSDHWRASRFNVTPLEVNAREAWVRSLPKFKLDDTHKIEVHVDDFPMLGKVFREVGEEDFNSHVSLIGLKEGEVYPDYNGLKDFIGHRKVKVAISKLNVAGEKASKGKPTLTQEQIAATVDVRPNLLSGEQHIDATTEFSARDIFAFDSYAEDYSLFMKGRGILKADAPNIDIMEVPQHARLTYNLEKFSNNVGGDSNFVTENMIVIKEQQKIYKQGGANAAANALGAEFYNRLVDINSGHVSSGAVPSGAGASGFGAASHNYGSLASKVEDIGAVATDAINQGKKKVRTALEGSSYALANNREAAIEYATISNKLRSIPGGYRLTPEGDAFEPAVIARWRQQAADAVEEGLEPPPMPKLDARTPERIDIENDIVRQAFKEDIEINGDVINKKAMIHTAQGKLYNYDPESYYAPPVDPKDYPFFALVTDESITTGGHSKMLYARTGQELDEMINKMRSNKHLTIRTKKDAEDYYDAIGRWSHEKTISSNYIDHEAARKGISAPYLVPTDPTKIVDDRLNFHLNRQTGLVREAIGAKYEVEFEELRRLGDQFTNASTSKFANTSLIDYAEEMANNPFADYIKTALAVGKNEQYPLWYNLNRTADRAISMMYNRVTQVFNNADNLDEAARDINPILEKAGYKGAHYDASMELFANASADRGVLSTAVQKANSILATVVLRWDAINAVNNAISANVLLGAETKAVIRAISKGDEEAAGALAKLTQIGVPGSGGATQFSAGKMIANSMSRFHGDKEALEFYRKNGYLTSIADQYRDTLDTLAFTGKESVSGWGSRLNKLFHKLGNKGEKFTGNKLAEEFNRFVAADVMKQMTDVAVDRGLMTAKEQLTYIRTFVNRTQGNYIASQRPIAFKGPLGQAIGLFQTYQFNLMQQLLRHIGEGTGKDAMTLLALQGTIHGMNGLPGFHAVNEHIIGNASGNTAHKDLYDAAYGVLGKEAGDWFTYGVGSNFLGLVDPDLKINLYTRGDINPRHVTLLPTNPAQIPIVQSYGRFIGNLINTYKQAGAGGDISTTLLQGLEHNGISRPLAGIATTLKGFNNPEWASYTTSKKGNVIASNDLLSLANLSRIAGAKPMDEAVAIDHMYRFKGYALRDAKRRNLLGMAIKSTMNAGQMPTTEQIEGFAARYVEQGGRQEEFSKWMTQLYKTANLSQANKLQQDLGNKFNESMQLLMGGEELQDFTP